MSSKKNILTVGFPRQLIEAVSHRDDLAFYVLEEEEIYNNNNFSQYKLASVVKIIFTEYMHSESYIEVIEQLNKEIAFSAVIPARDYAVRASAAIAEILGLPGLGVNAAKCLTNKVLLREVCAKNAIPHPRFQKIESKEELQNFFIDKPVIFKPANRQASLGISKIGHIDDIAFAWEYTTNAKEDAKRVVSRTIPSDFIAEEYLEGYEVSIESFVQNYKPVFHNITAKTTFGDTFVELQHVVPAQLDEELCQDLIMHKENFIKAVNVKDGTLHSEWKIDNNKPYIIECAGRHPGDSICDLISQSYQFNFYNEMCNNLCGEPLHINATSSMVSAVRFFTSTPGILKEIKGTENLNAPEIITSSITVKPGDSISHVRSSWDRIGFFITVAKTYNDLFGIIENTLESVEFINEN